MRITRSGRFKRDYKQAKRQHKNLHLLKDVIEQLVKRQKLPDKFRDHKLTGSLKEYRELHLEPDWLLIYRIDHNEDELKLARLGPHSELYRK
ncbi:MAG: type II toxin-antitoxin system YafQ family toxin [Deltaproteobacteria bacterium]|nr:type II toxin-antitoxin system YafQ family toxin [Deltaproteobacteria bacterium]